MNFHNKDVQETVAYLSSKKALDAISNDPYWPKWNTPWWRIVVLFEMGLVDQVPNNLINHLIDKINNHYLKFFPITEQEVPEGIDVNRQALCHCALGSIYQALHTYGIDVDVKLPWIRPWFLKYQLPDGGLNCDEEAYTKSKKSSIVSTLPVLEAVAFCSKGSLTSQEVSFVDKGTSYLIDHKLIYRSNQESIMHADFMQLSFPRFYEYDILRGLHYLVRWRELRNKDDADETIAWGIKTVQQKMVNGALFNERISFNEDKTLTPTDNGQWEWLESHTFPLLDTVSKIGSPSEQLTKIFFEITDS